MQKIKNAKKIVALNLVMIMLLAVLPFNVIAAITGGNFPLAMVFDNLLLNGGSQSFNVETPGEYTFRIRLNTPNFDTGGLFQVSTPAGIAIQPISTNRINVYTIDLTFDLEPGAHTIEWGAILPAATAAGLRLFQGRSAPQGFAVDVETVGNGNANPTWPWRWESDFNGFWPGEVVNITARPDVATGQRFDRWEIISGGVTVNTANSPNTSFVMPANAVSLRAVFEHDPSLPTVTAITNNPAWGGASASVWDGYASLSAFPSPGFAFVGWNVVSGNVTITPEPNFPHFATFPWPPIGNVLVEAVFREMVNPRTVTASANDPNRGNAWASPAIAEPGDEVWLGTSTFVWDEVNQTSINSGYEFDRWEVISPTGLTITYNAYGQGSFIMPNADVSVRAIFIDPATITPVTGVSIAGGNFNLTVGNTRTLTATVAPANATNRNVTWTSSNTSVATVTANGLVRAIAPGTATITARTAEGNFTNSVTVTVSGQQQQPPAGGNGGGNSGDHSGAATTTPSAPATTIPANIGADIAVRISRTQATLTLPTSVVNNIIRDANGVVSFNLSRLDNITTAVVPRAAWNRFADAGLGVELVLPDGILLFDADTSRSVARQVGNANISSTISTVNPASLSQVQRDLANTGDSVFRVSVNVGAHSITSFDGGISVTVPYSGPVPVRVLHVDVDGNATRLPVTVNSSSVTFITDQLSVFVVGYDAEVLAEVLAPIEAPSVAVPVIAPQAVNLNTASLWSHNYITRAFDLGIIPEHLQNQYTNPMTRAEFAALSVALFETAIGHEIPVSAGIFFEDTMDRNVLKAAQIGVVQGIGDNLFAPHDLLTREQAATMLTRLASALNMPLSTAYATFADTAQISHWAIEGVGQVQAAGIMTDIGDNLFSPLGSYTREQSIATMIRLLDYFQS